MTDAPVTYTDADFVYVDPFTRTVIGKVEWTKDGMPKPKAFTAAPPESQEEAEKPAKAAKGEKGKRPRKAPSLRYYPWGTYRSMKRIYRLEGKVKDMIEPSNTLDTILPKALEQPFWD